MPHRCAAPRATRGSALIVTLIMLVLLTVLVGSTFALSSTDMKSVANTQLRDEAIAAANAAIEQVITSPFTNNPQPEQIAIDINNSGTPQYFVNFVAPTCVRASALVASSPPPSSLSLPASFNTAGATFFNTVWDLDARVTDVASGASAHVHQGVRVLLDQTQYAKVCP
ncbi:MAG: hypothetical protein PVS2B3_09790 [Steroidobacteraceae bacterium]